MQSSGRRLVPFLSLVAVLALTVLGLSTRAVAAQDAPTVLILPIDHANFLPGQKFDVQIEVWADSLPSDFAVTINGKAAADVLGAQPESSSWQFDPAAGNALTYTYRKGLTGPLTSQATTWRGVTVNEPGDYQIAVTAGGNTTTATWTVREPGAGQAKNVIFFVGDGMATGVRTAARLVSRGLNDGGKYSSNLNMETMPVWGMLATNGYDSIITDSANSMSAYMTGQKGVVNSMGVYADTSAESGDDPQVATFAELAKARGMSVGVCVTSRVTDATPAATWGHTRRRDEEATLIDQALKLNFDVILGGGSIFFQPQSVAGSDRKDDRDLFNEFEQAGYQVITSATELKAVDTAATDKLLGIFSASHMNVWIDRNLFPDNVTKNGPDQPGLMDECKVAIDILSRNDRGFFLMVEGSDIDKQEHSMSWQRAVADLIEFDNVIGYAKDWAAQNGNNTLIAVTADHAHSFDVYGTVDLGAYDALAAQMNAAATATAEATATSTEEASAFPANDPRLNAIKVYQDAGIPDYKPGTDNFPESWDVQYPLAVTWGDHPPYTDDFRLDPKPNDAGFLPQGGEVVPNPARDPDGIYFTGNLPLNSSQEVHTMQDVPVTATGPGAECFNGWHENTDVFFCLASAISLDPRQSESADASATPEATKAAAAVLPFALVAGVWTTGKMIRSRKSDEA